MITDQEQYKRDRKAAKTIDDIRAFAAKYSIKLRGTDEEIMALFHAGPQWEEIDPVTMRPWRLVTSSGQVVREFRSKMAAVQYQEKNGLGHCRIVENT